MMTLSFWSHKIELPVYLTLSVLKLRKKYCICEQVKGCKRELPFPFCSSLCVSCPVTSDSTTPWTVARQAPVSMRFPRQEHWSGCHSFSRFVTVFTIYLLTVPFRILDVCSLSIFFFLNRIIKKFLLEGTGKVRFVLIVLPLFWKIVLLAM